MAKHVKTDEQESIDRKRQKQLAVLWRAQEIYRLANEACEKNGAYEDNKAAKEYYFGVLNAMDAARRALKKGEAAPNLTNKIDKLNEIPGPKNCSSDADCPVDYVCDEGTCWYLYSDPPAAL